MTKYRIANHPNLTVISNFS